MKSRMRTRSTALSLAILYTFLDMSQSSVVRLSLRSAGIGIVGVRSAGVGIAGVRSVGRRSREAHLQRASLLVIIMQSLTDVARGYITV